MAIELLGTITALANSNDFPSSASLLFSGRLAAGKESFPSKPFRPARVAASPVIQISPHPHFQKKPVVVIDNYDSFTYNLCQYLGCLGCSYEVYRNDELTIQGLLDKDPAGVLISPGPGTPQDSGISLETVLKIGPTIPLFGVCMGLQCMGEAYGGRIIRSPHGVVHGKKSLVYYDQHGEDGLFAGLPNPFVAGRYHSLVIDTQTFPHEELEITAWTEDNLVMGVRHKKYRHVQGVQFHPESIITEDGMKIMGNFLRLLEVTNKQRNL